MAHRKFVRISSQCTGALAGLLGDSGAACLNPSGLVPLLSAGQNTSVVGPVDTYLQGMCKQSACTNDTLATVVNDVTTGCQAELQSFGLGNITTSQLTSLVQQFYPSLREMLCLQEYVRFIATGRVNPELTNRFAPAVPATTRSARLSS